MACIRDIMQAVVNRIFPRPTDETSGGACREAAFDPEQFPESMRKILKKSESTAGNPTDDQGKK